MSEKIDNNIIIHCSPLRNFNLWFLGGVFLSSLSLISNSNLFQELEGKFVSSEKLKIFLRIKITKIFFQTLNKIKINTSSYISSIK